MRNLFQRLKSPLTRMWDLLRFLSCREDISRPMGDVSFWGVLGYCHRHKFDTPHKLLILVAEFLIL
jgi:hypothetical protein